MDYVDEKQLNVIYAVRKYAREYSNKLYLDIDKYGVFTLVWEPRFSCKYLCGPKNPTVVGKHLYISYDYPLLRVQGHDTLYDLRDSKSSIREYYYVFMKNLKRPYIGWEWEEKYKLFHALKNLYTDVVLPNEEHVATIRSFNVRFQLLRDNILLTLDPYSKHHMSWEEYKCHEVEENPVQFEVLVGAYKYHKEVPSFVAERYNLYINRYTIDDMRIIDVGLADDVVVGDISKKAILYALQHLYDVDIMIKSAVKK